MHFREAKFPDHVQVESVVGGSSLPQIRTEPEHLMLLSIFRNNIVPNLHSIFSVHKPDRNDTMIKRTQHYLRWDKVLKPNARNRHRMGGKLEKPWLGVYIIQKDLGKGRYCLKTLEGKPIKQTIHCARLKRFLDPASS